MSIEKVLYRANATVTGGREGHGAVSDKRLDVKLSTPKELGGAGGDGTNPEHCSPWAIRPASSAP